MAPVHSKMSLGASSKAYFDKMKALADKLDGEVARLEAEVRRKILLAAQSDDKSGYAAPVCDEMSEAIDEMAESVEALNLEVERTNQALEQHIGQALDSHDDLRSLHGQALERAAKYGYQATPEELEFVDKEIDVADIKRKILEEREEAAAKKKKEDGKEEDTETDLLQSPNLFSMGLSKDVLRSMGVHFRSDEDKEAAARNGCQKTNNAQKNFAAFQANADYYQSSANFSAAAASSKLSVHATNSIGLATTTNQSVDVGGGSPINTDFDDSLRPPAPSIKLNDYSLEEDSTDSDSPAVVSILKTSTAAATAMSAGADASMEASRVEISPGLKVKRPQAAAAAKAKKAAAAAHAVRQPPPPPPPPPIQRTSTLNANNDSSFEIPEFNTVNVEAYLKQYKASVNNEPVHSHRKTLNEPVHAQQQRRQEKQHHSRGDEGPVHLPSTMQPSSEHVHLSRQAATEKKAVATPSMSCLDSPELPILKTMDISKLFHNNHLQQQRQMNETGKVVVDSQPLAAAVAAVATAAVVPSPRSSAEIPEMTRQPSAKENLLDSPEGKEEFMKILKKYESK